MADKRKHERYTVKKEIDLRVLLASEISLKDISLGGVHFTCTKRLTTNSYCAIDLSSCGRKTHVKGKIVRSSFKGVKFCQGENQPLYEVAMEFVELSADQVVCLEKIVQTVKKQ